MGRGGLADRWLTGGVAIMARRFLMGLLVLAAALILGGGFWLAFLMLRGGADTQQLLRALWWDWAGLIGGSGLVSPQQSSSN